MAESLIICLEDNASKVRIENGCTFESTVISVADDHNYVVIGEDCMFARDVCLMASDFHSILDTKSGRRSNVKLGIIIGDHVWCGYRSAVLKGCSIAGHVVLAAGSTAIHSIDESYVVASGHPAKVIRHDAEWTRRRIPVLDERDGTVTLNEEISDSDKQVSNLENLDSGKIAYLSGWSYMKDMDSRDSQLLVEITLLNGTKKYITPHTEKRADVADYFKDQRYLYSGFYVYIPVGQGSDTVWENIAKIRIIIENEKIKTANTVWVKDSVTGTDI